MRKSARAKKLLSQGSASTKFVIVSAVSFADGVSLTYTGKSSVAGNANVIKVGKFTLNITYDCSDVASINKSAQSAAQKPPVLFFYVPVRLGSDGSAQVDPQAPDLTKYRFTAALF